LKKIKATGVVSAEWSASEGCGETAESIVQY
jgi:hypothetical protein